MAPHNQESLARRGEHLKSIAICFLVSSWTFIALRVWTRTCIISQFGWDDATMVLAGMLFTSYCTCVLYIEDHGGGTHITSTAQLTMLTKWVIASEVTYLITVLVLKVSLGIFFSRIIVNRWQLRLIHVALAVTALSSVSAAFYCIFRCGANLDDYVLRQLVNRCTPRALDRFFAYQHASFSFLTDCVFATLPILILWNVHMERQWKTYVGLILSLAGIGCVCSAIRFRYVEGLTQIEDFFWNATSISVWSTIEPGVAIIASCLATLRPFLKWIREQAQSVRSSLSHASERTAKSMQSAKNASLPKHGDVGQDTGARRQAPIELSDGGKRESTEGMLLSQRQALEMLFPSEPSWSLELDRTSTRTTRKTIDAILPHGRSNRGQ